MAKPLYPKWLYLNACTKRKCICKSNLVHLGSFANTVIKINSSSFFRNVQSLSEAAWKRPVSHRVEAAGVIWKIPYLQLWNVFLYKTPTLSCVYIDNYPCCTPKGFTPHRLSDTKSKRSKRKQKFNCCKFPCLYI